MAKITAADVEGRQLALHITGTRPILLHNGQLANPLNEHTQRLKALTGKRKKTDEDYFAMMRVELQGGVYETPEGLLGLPTDNVWRCIYDAATAFKQGENMKRGLLSEDTIEPLLVSGKKMTPEEAFADPEFIDYRPVKVQRNKTMRARLKVPHWSTTHYFEVLEDVLDLRELAPILQRAGRLVGLGDWHPKFGRFVCEPEVQG